jgi:hypothetical protein
MEKEATQYINTAIPESQEVPQSAAQIPENPKQKSRLVIGLIILVLLLLGTTGFLAYQNYQLKQQVQQKQPFTNPTIGIPTPTATPSIPAEIQPTNKPNAQPITIPSDWKQYIATDPDFGITTKMSMPPGYSFRFTGSEFTIQNDSDATELWDYSTSIFRGKDGLKNYYTGGSRRSWYQELLSGEFMLEKPYQFVPGQITNVLEHQINSQSYLELTVSGGPPTNYSGETGTHYIYGQNSILHIIKPASHKANSADALIPNYIGTIFVSLNSSSTK